MFRFAREIKVGEPSLKLFRRISGNSDDFPARARTVNGPCLIRRYMYKVTWRRAFAHYIRICHSNDAYLLRTCACTDCRPTCYAVPHNRDDAGACRMLFNFNCGAYSAVFAVFTTLEYFICRAFWIIHAVICLAKKNQYFFYWIFHSNSFVSFPDLFPKAFFY